MDRLSPSTLKVLLAVIELHQHSTVSIRDIADALDWRAHSYVAECLVRLKNAGLVAYEPHLAGTIRPTCTVQLFGLTPTEEV